MMNTLEGGLLFALLAITFFSISPVTASSVYEIYDTIEDPRELEYQRTGQVPQHARATTNPPTAMPQQEVQQVPQPLPPPPPIPTPECVIAGRRFQNIRKLEGPNATEELARYPQALVVFVAYWDRASLRLLSELSRVEVMSLSEKVNLVETHHGLRNNNNNNNNSDQDPPFPLLAVDAFLEPVVRRQYGINRFPMVYYVETGVLRVQYKGPTRTGDIRNFIERLIHFSFEALRSEREFTVALGMAEVCLVVYAPSKEYTAKEPLQKLIPALEHAVATHPVFFVYADQSTSAIPYLRVMERMPDFWRHRHVLVVMYRKKASAHSPFMLPDSDMHIASLTEAGGTALTDEAAFLAWLSRVAVPYVSELTVKTFPEHFHRARRRDGALVVLLASEIAMADIVKRPHYSYRGGSMCYEMLRQASVAVDSQLRGTFTYHYMDAAAHKELARRLCVGGQHVPAQSNVGKCSFLLVGFHDNGDAVETIVTERPPTTWSDLSRIDPEAYCKPMADTTTSSSSSESVAWHPLFDRPCTVKSTSSSSPITHERRHSVWTHSVHRLHVECDDDHDERQNTKRRSRLVIIQRPSVCAHCLLMAPSLSLFSEVAQVHNVPVMVEVVDAETTPVPRPLAPLVRGYPEIFYVNGTHVVRYEGIDRTPEGLLEFVGLVDGSLMPFARDSLPTAPAGAPVLQQRKRQSRERYARYRVGVGTLQNSENESQPDDNNNNNHEL